MQQKPRRDKCFVTAEKMAALTPAQRLAAWQLLTWQMATLGDLDMPKFRDLLSSIRLAAEIARRAIK